MRDERRITVLGRWAIVLRRRTEPIPEFAAFSEACRELGRAVRTALLETSGNS